MRPRCNAGTFEAETRVQFGLVVAAGVGIVGGAGMDRAGVGDGVVGTVGTPGPSSVGIVDGDFAVVGAAALAGLFGTSSDVGV